MNRHKGSGAAAFTIRCLTVGLWAVATLPALGQEAVGGAEAAPLDHGNVVILLDASGSMGRPMADSQMTKMAAAKAALRETLTQAPPDTHIGLLVFSAHGAPQEWFYPLGPREDARLLEAIDAPSPGGGTPLGKYIRRAADRLLEQRARQRGYGAYRLLIVTDGEADDPDKVDRYTAEILARGVTMDVIGVDMKSDHTLAAKAHSYRRANDPESLRKAVADVFAEVADAGGDAAAENAFAEIAPIPSEIAAAMLEALARSGNEPIGGSRERAAARPATRISAQQTPTQTRARRTSFLSTPIVTLIVVFLAVSVVMRAARRRRR